MNKLMAAALACAVIAAAVVTASALKRDAIRGAIAKRSADAAFKSRRLNVLLLGYQDDEGNSDTIILAHLDIERHTATFVSVPRDTWVAIPGHGHEKINAAIGYGGPALSAKVVSALLGVPIDATLAVQPEGAKQLVDALGGLNVDVEHDMDYDDENGNLHIHLKQGEQYLTGGQVLGYIRFRHDGESDWGRVRRQQDVLKRLIDQMSRPENWSKIGRLLALARRDMKTSLSDTQLAALVEIYRNVPDDDIRTFTLPGSAAFVGDASVVIADRRWAHLIGRLLFSKNEPPQEPVLFANATGLVRLDKTVVAALRGGGWNVATFVDQPARTTTTVYGSDRAAALLTRDFGVAQKPAKTTTLVTGTDFVPST